MSRDEAEIRQLVSTWMSATKAGDVDTILGLVTDDAVFLVPGREPMRKPEFEAAVRAQAAPGAPRFDGTSEIREVQVAGDLAFAWAKLHVAVTPADGSPALAREGHTLTVFRRTAGRWQLARDANLLGAARQQAL